MAQRHPPTDLVVSLRTIQLYFGWSDEEMAQKCGVRARMWQYVKTGSSRLGSRSLAAIVSSFPGSREDVLAYMADAPSNEDAA